MKSSVQSITARLLTIGLFSLTAISCSEQTTLDPVAPNGSRMLPLYVDYNSTGTLAHLVYRSRFTYDNANRLLAISDSLLYSSSSLSSQPNEWVRFGFTNNVLTTVDLPRLVSTPSDPGPITYSKAAHFELTYSGQTVHARLLLDGQEASTASFDLDAAGFPVKANATLGGLIFDGRGNIDYIAVEKRKQANPLYTTEVLTQQYDANKNVFADSKEVQLLVALLTVTHRSEALSGLLGSGLLGVGNALTTNNLLRRKTRRCDPTYGCADFDESVIDSQVVNEYQLPTERLCTLGALGIFRYTVHYKQVE